MDAKYYRVSVIIAVQGRESIRDSVVLINSVIKTHRSISNIKSHLLD